MLRILPTLLALLPLSTIASPAPFTGQDYSGRYECTGRDSHIGDFKGFIEMRLDPQQSTADHGAYTFALTLEDNTRYDGFAAATGALMALYFAHPDPALKDYGVGVARLAEDANGKRYFSKYYYGPQYQGGGHGFEHCTQL